MKINPLLSIGIIFKNEARCIERCLQSLEPLRQAIPCELIMADTGADDGSRTIAEQYADEVFDFAWCDDFAAARNAVMDRCTGKWYFSIDCDEWLDTDLSELLAFLQSKKNANFGFVNVRNYKFAELEQSDVFSDFLALRLVRMATGQRYTGTIHESWLYEEPFVRLTRTILHHDGYVYTDFEQEKRKSRRNMKLLHLELEQDPKNLRTLIHCIDSSRNSPDHVQFIRQAINVVHTKQGNWKKYGGLILRSAIKAAQVYELPELDEWIKYAEEQFSDSIFVQVDGFNTAFEVAYNAKQWDQAVRYGEAYRKGLRSLHTTRSPQKVEAELQLGDPQMGHPNAERTLLIGLADAYCQNKQSKKALQTLAELDGTKLDAKQVRNYVITLCHLYAQSLEDVAPVLTAFYEQISLETPNRRNRQVRLAAFDAIAAAIFTKKYQKEETELTGYHRPACTVFRCLSNHCEAGRASAVIMANDTAEMREWLLAVENWQVFPIEALKHALHTGIAFPPEETPLPLEVLEGLAVKLTSGENLARQILLTLSENEEYPSLQSLFWVQSLAMAALRSFDWSLGKNDVPVSKFACPEKKEDEMPKCTPEEGLALIRRFAQIESAVLPLLYTPQALSEENAALLPPMHRWGLYCSLALEALDAGNSQEYLALLRKGLAACPGQKEIVQFLLDRFREDARPKASPELLALAEKVRTILSAYDPADPAVAALKASPAYQQVAWLIEGPNAGGLPS